MTNDKHVSDVGGTGKCSYCGRQGHGKSPSLDVRKDKCRAWGKSCNKCSGETHFANVCKQSKPAAANTVQDVEETQLFNMFSEPSRPVHKRYGQWVLSHMACDKFGKWVQLSPELQLSVNIDIAVSSWCWQGWGYHGQQGALLHCRGGQQTAVVHQLGHHWQGLNQHGLQCRQCQLSIVSLNSCARADEGD